MGLTANVFKGRTYWECPQNVGTTWNLKKLLRLKERAREFTRIQLGDGGDASFWYDSWLEIGPLIEFIGMVGPRLLRLPKTARVKDAVHEGSWLIRGARNERVQQLQTILSRMEPPSPDNGSDQPLWRKNDDNYHPTFVSRLTWDKIRTPAAPVSWFGLVWFEKAIPRHAFLLWQVLHQRLPTSDRVARWGIQGPSRCILCRKEVETLSHLFFCCEYSADVWLSLAGNLGGSPPRVVVDAGPWINQHLMTTQRTTKLIKSLLLQLVVYEIWKERNGRTHKDVANSPQQLWFKIDRIMRNILISLHKPDSTGSNDPLQQWYRLMYYD
ncbi:PREDICTED: uncharacterized protein LOC104807041 [Tarenaya hassleriana]|uniref:uncharacterized protein LOC104807041 n=1 Tax=Tarenaya hassleriana TaxID=28532 RepID=UPI00053C98C7|nr:PREDICTED: uncharacterized protein LOC104807041 [Tarenaya hassleriana]